MINRTKLIFFILPALLICQITAGLTRPNPDSACAAFGSPDQLSQPRKKMMSCLELEATGGDSTTSFKSICLNSLCKNWNTNTQPAIAQGAPSSSIDSPLPLMRGIVVNVGK